MRNLGSALSDLKGRMADAGSALQEAQRRMSQQALEAAGLSERTDGLDDAPELRTHAQLESSLRKLYERSEKYMRAMNTLSDVSRALADEFMDAFDDEPDLKAVAAQFRYAHYEATQNQLRGLGQTLHRKVFQPVRREIEGRKDLEKRLSDRKKVRLDYDAYRRKQMGLLTTDPANKREYEANLEQARMTFQRHSQGVMRDVAVVNAARQETLCAAFMGVVCSQLEYWTGASDAMAQVMAAASASEESERWSAAREEVAALAVQKVAARTSQASARTSQGSAHGARRSSQSPPQQQQGQAQQQQQAQAQAQAQQQAPPPPPPPSDFGSYTPPSAPPPPEHHDPFGILGGPPAAASHAPPQSNGFASTAVQDDFFANTAKPAAPSSQVDLLNGFDSHRSTSNASPAADLMGGSDMDDLMGLAAPPALVAQGASAVSNAGRSHNDSFANDLDMFMGTGAPAQRTGSPLGMHLPPNGRSMHHAPSEPNLMGDLMGGHAPPATSRGASMPMAGPPGAAPDRSALIAAREAEKQAAIADKVNNLRIETERTEANREKERDLEKVVKQQVGQWQQDKKNLRALLASLHEIAPPCQWQPVGLAQLLDPAAVKKAYRKALLAVHPDKQPTDDLHKKVLAQHIFDALRDAWHRFEQTG
mmetsp:Transcript_1323/g.2596  ORF Transcript_1323/g.2596 Transcript_1323/m.2596 type:complete len:649 (+) Transcript_1323:47-1993(+)